MNSEQGDNHFLTITKTSFYKGSLMKTSWHVSKHAINRCTRGSLKVSFPSIKSFKVKYSKDFASTCCNILYVYIQITHDDKVIVSISDLIQRNKQFTKELMFVTILWRSLCKSNASFFLR